MQEKLDVLLNMVDKLTKSVNTISKQLKKQETMSFSIENNLEFKVHIALCLVTREM